MMRAESDSETRGNALVGAFSLLAGIFAAALIALIFALPSPTPPNVLSSYTSNTNLFAALFAVTVIFAVFGILFFGGLGRLLAAKSPKVASGAALVSAFGVLILALGPILFVGALSAITMSPAGATYQAIAIYQAAFWSAMTFSFIIGGALFISGGLILFGWLSWKTGILPNWLSYVGCVGGAAGFLQIVAPGFISFLLLPVFFAAMAIWGLVVGAVLLRRPHSTQSVTTVS
jgi:hypothetical protein